MEDSPGTFSSGRCGCPKLTLGISLGKRMLLIISYSRTVWLQRGPLLCAAWSRALEVWSSLFFPFSFYRDICNSLRNTVLWLREIKWWCLWGAVMRYHQGQKILTQNILNAINLYDLRQKASFTLAHIQLAKPANTHRTAHIVGSFLNH